MALGSTGTLNVSPEMMTNAISAVGEYREAASNLLQQLTDVVGGLIPGSFSGSAADGFKFFFDNKVVPVASTDLEKLLKAVEEICDGILKGITNDSGVDEQLASGNKQ